MTVRFTPAPSPRWSEVIGHAVQIPAFADASRRLGYRPLYCEDGARAALVQVRSPLPGAGRVIGRAYVYPSGEDARFLGDVVAALRRRGLPFIRVGNTMWGVRERASLAIAGCTPRIVERRTAVIDLRRDDEALLASMDGIRREIRKAERERVEVGEALTRGDVAEYHALAKTTADRIRARQGFTEHPLAFFLDVYDRLVPTGAARIYLARAGGELIAATLMLVHRDTMLYFHGASTRDRAHTLRRAHTACVWAAVQAAKKAGLARFDLGGFTPTTDPTDPRAGVYAFKKRWGGTVETFYNAEIPLSPVVYAIQQRLAGPLWQRLHPLLWRLTA